MFYFRIHAVRISETAGGHLSKGAYVSCWVNFGLQDGAEVLARHYIHQAGWKVESVEEVLFPERKDYWDRQEIEYFDEATRDGVSLVFHCYPDEGET